MSLITAFLDSFLYTSLPGFYLKKKRVQSTKTKLFHHSSWQSKEAVICNFFSSEKKQSKVQQLLMFPCFALQSYHFCIIYKISKKKENLHRSWSIEDEEVIFFLYAFSSQQVENTKMSPSNSKCFFFILSCQTCKGDSHGMECIFLFLKL